MTLTVWMAVKMPPKTLRLNDMKKNRNHPVKIGMTDEQLDRREAILEAKRRREEIRAKHNSQNQWAWAFVA